MSNIGFSSWGGPSNDLEYIDEGKIQPYPLDAHVQGYTEMNVHTSGRDEALIEEKSILMRKSGKGRMNNTLMSCFLLLIKTMRILFKRVLS